ncbi:hypothetical protein VPH35_033832 [Triticum aestivum]
MARVVWRTVGSVLGTDLCPNKICQYFSWCFVFLPDGARFYTFGLAAICWAIWNTRNRATFEFKLPSTPFKILFSACVFINYWTGLLKGADHEAMKRGAQMLRENACTMMRLCAASTDETAS